MGALALRPADLREFDGQARVQDLRLAEILGFDRPRKIRDLIRRNFARLERHGLICSTVGRIKIDDANPRGAGRRSNEYWLNERQAYRLCMWSAAPNAEAVQEQMVEVFFAYRHGKLIPAADQGPPRDVLMDIVARMELLERAVAVHPVREAEGYPAALAHVPLPKHHRYPAFWSDLPVREMAVRLHRQMAVREAIECMVSELGRAPSKSALARFWMWMDKVSGRAIGRSVH